MAVWCTKTSAPPSGCEMKPKPFSALNHLTVPEATVAFPFPPHASCPDSHRRMTRRILPHASGCPTTNRRDSLRRKTLAALRAESTPEPSSRKVFTRRSLTADPGPLGAVFGQPAGILQLGAQGIGASPVARRPGLVALDHLGPDGRVLFVAGAGPEREPEGGTEQRHRLRFPVGTCFIAGVGGAVGLPHQIEHRGQGARR